MREETAGTRRVVLSELAKYDISLDDLKVFIEVYSDPDRNGHSSRRKELQRMMKDIRAGRVQIMVVHRLDHFSRTLRDLMISFERMDDRRVFLGLAVESIENGA